MRDNWIQIAGRQKRIQDEWEQTRALAYNIGRFGQSDPKKFPKTPQRFWEFPWDKKEVKLSAQEIRAQWEAGQKLLAEMIEKQKVKDAEKKRAINAETQAKQLAAYKQNKTNG